MVIHNSKSDLPLEAGFNTNFTLTLIRKNNKMNSVVHKYLGMYLDGMNRIYYSKTAKDHFTTKWPLDL